MPKSTSVPKYNVFIIEAMLKDTQTFIFQGILESLKRKLSGNCPFCSVSTISTASYATATAHNNILY